METDDSVTNTEVGCGAQGPRPGLHSAVPVTTAAGPSCMNRGGQGGTASMGPGFESTRARSSPCPQRGHAPRGLLSEWPLGTYCPRLYLHFPIREMQRGVPPHGDFVGIKRTEAMFWRGKFCHDPASR